MGQVDDLHDAEDQRQPGRHQKEGDAELQAVQELFNDENIAMRLQRQLPAHRLMSDPGDR